MTEDKMVDTGTCYMEKRHYDKVANCEHGLRTMKDDWGIVSIVCPKCTGFWTINPEPATEIWTAEQLAWEKEISEDYLKKMIETIDENTTMGRLGEIVSFAYGRLYGGYYGGIYDRDKKVTDFWPIEELKESLHKYDEMMKEYAESLKKKVEKEGEE